MTSAVTDDQRRRAATEEDGVAGKAHREADLAGRAQSRAPQANSDPIRALPADRGVTGADPGVPDGRGGTHRAAATSCSRDAGGQRQLPGEVAVARCPDRLT